MKKILSLALMIGGALMTLVTAYEVYAISLYESEGGNQGISAADWLFIVGPTILSIAAVFVGWRLYKSIPEKPYSEASTSKPRAGLFLVLLGTGIAFFPALMTIRQLPYDPLTTPYLDIIWMFFTLPIGGVIAIFGLVQRSDGKTRKMRAPIAKPDQSADQVQAPKEDQAVYQPRSCIQVGLILIAMCIGLMICFGAVSSFMNMSLHESWAILGVLQLLAGGAIIFWGIRRLRNK